MRGLPRRYRVSGRYVAGKRPNDRIVGCCQLVAKRLRRSLVREFIRRRVLPLELASRARLPGQPGKCATGNRDCACDYRSVDNVPGNRASGACVRRGRRLSEISRRELLLISLLNRAIRRLIRHTECIISENGSTGTITLSTRLKL